jgi:hypothetical protein
VQSEQGRHDCERGADEHRSPLTAACARHREQHGRERGGKGGHADAEEVPAAVDDRSVAAQEVQEQRWDRGSRPAEGEDRDCALSKALPHPLPIGTAARVD